jgi:hypothetical protein
MGLLAAQGLLFLSVVALRRNTTYLGTVFAIAGGLGRRGWGRLPHPGRHGSSSPTTAAQSGKAALRREARAEAPCMAQGVCARLPFLAPFAAAVVYFGERLNAVGAKHWRAFAGQPYFDPHGAFFAAVVSGPLVLTLFTVLVGARPSRARSARSPHGSCCRCAVCWLSCSGGSPHPLFAPRAPRSCTLSRWSQSWWRSRSGSCRTAPRRRGGRAAARRQRSKARRGDDKSCPPRHVCIRQPDRLAESASFTPVPCK